MFSDDDVVDGAGEDFSGCFSPTSSLRFTFKLAMASMKSSVSGSFSCAFDVGSGTALPS
ncbi:hypothetical protein BX666DRAFT_1948485 [Dichotomocladium elegans]|nr:hypothetical protein BX666DRAFT_1948485 [Dichotomocladium elegans]